MRKFQPLRRTVYAKSVACHRGGRRPNLLVRRTYIRTSVDLDAQDLRDNQDPLPRVDTKYPLHSTTDNRFCGSGYHVHTLRRLLCALD